MLASHFVVVIAIVSFLVLTCLCSEGFKVSQVLSLNKTPRGGPAALVRAYSKHGVPVTKSLATAATAQLKRQRGSSSADLVDYEIMYATPITIGGQNFNMQFDTGSSAV